MVLSCISELRHLLLLHLVEMKRTLSEQERQPKALRSAIRLFWVAAHVTLIFTKLLPSKPAQESVAFAAGLLLLPERVVHRA